jgi:tyrosyl-tRNA synthetase
MINNRLLQSCLIPFFSRCASSQVRRQEQQSVKLTEKAMHEERLREAVRREQHERDAVARAADELRAAFEDEGVTPVSASAPDAAACAGARAETVACYQKHGKDNPALCTSQVANFAACARAMRR